MLYGHYCDRWDVTSNTPILLIWPTAHRLFRLQRTGSIIPWLRRFVKMLLFSFSKNSEIQTFEHGACQEIGKHIWVTSSATGGVSILSTLGPVIAIIQMEHQGKRPWDAWWCLKSPQTKSKSFRICERLHLKSKKRSGFSWKHSIYARHSLSRRPASPHSAGCQTTMFGCPEMLFMSGPCYREPLHIGPFH